MKFSSFAPRKTPMRTTSQLSRSAKPMKMRKCKICRINEVPNIYASICIDMECILTYANRERDKRLAKEVKVERTSIKVRKEAIKTRSDYMKEAQIAFNAYVRLRDACLSCICCAQPLGDAAIGGGYDCGHYRSVGSAPHLRFDERNAHAQRKQCNRYGAGRAVDYRIGLIACLGIAMVEALESDTTVKKYTISDLIAIRNEYRAKLKALKKLSE